jgi:hypothetical protein
MTNFNPDLPLSCFGCNESFESWMKLAKHLNSVAMAKSWMKFKTSPLLLPEEVVVNLSGNHEIQDLSVQCHFCQEKSDNPENHLKHFKIEHKDQGLKGVFKCEECGESNSAIEAFENHRRYHERVFV